MKKVRLYVDTSVLSGLFDTEDPKRVMTAERLVNSTNLRMGYKSIEIVSPEEVIGYGEMGI